jgi:hypothetical protein
LRAPTPAIERFQRLLERQRDLDGARSLLPQGHLRPEALETQGSRTCDKRIVLAAAEAVPRFPGAA